jgi:hypothetical protein
MCWVESDVDAKDGAPVLGGERIGRHEGADDV